MAKKNMRKIAALTLAVTTALSTIGMSVNADLTESTDGKSVSGTAYKVVITEPDSNGINVTTTTYYTTKSAADSAAGANGKVSSVNVTTIGKTIYVSGGQIYIEDPGSAAEYKTTGTGSTSGNATYTTPSSAHRYYSNTIYQSTLTGFFYPNLPALQNVEGAHTNYSTHTPTTNYSPTNCYFDPISGTYSSTSANTYSYTVKGAASTTDSTSVYKVGGYYYPTYAAAYSAAGGNSSLITWIRDYTSAPTNFFSEVTGSFYSSYEAALYASNGASDKVTVFNGAYDDYYDYYGFLYGYDYYDYYDPYYYYYLNRYNDSSSNKDTTSATIGTRKGWTSIAKYLKSISAGSTATVDMNNETVVPSSVLSAIKGRNVNVKFVLDNGVTFTVNGKDVSTAKDVDIDTTYNTKSISNKLIKAAYSKNKAVSSAQLSVDAGSLGFTSDLTVKFSAKRANYKAKLYRYNASKNSLQLVDSATIAKSGKCTFDKVTKGGEFVIVIYK